MRHFQVLIVLMAFLTACSTVEAPEDREETASDFWASVRTELFPAGPQTSRAMNIPSQPSQVSAPDTTERSTVGVAPRELSEMMLDHIERILSEHPEWGATVQEYFEIEKERGVRTDEQRVGLRTMFIRYLLRVEAER